jgi:hypothetical protein
MSSLTILSAKYGIAAKLVKRLFEGEGLRYDDEEFDIDRCHQKAINEIARKRISPYVLAYAQWCRAIAGPDEFFVRYDSLVEIAHARGFYLSEELSDIGAKHFDIDRLPSGKYWLDRLADGALDREAVDRIASWIRTMLMNAPPGGVQWAYVSARLLWSLPIEAMPDYPRIVQRAMNLAMHYGDLDGWHVPINGADGKPARLFVRPKFDL